jgi:glutathione synthase/RimK-type ligase-like ATP-grasp enzyme
LKVFDPTAKRTRTDDLPICNTATGWRYDHSFKPPDHAVKLAKRAVQELGYLWGGVDILEDAKGACYVLEVNSAPGMDDTTAHAYADAIEKHVLKTHGH